MKQGLSGSWFALLATSTVSPKQLLGESPDSLGVFNSRGELVARSRAELWQSTLLAPINYDAAGRSVDATSAFTGMNSGGESASSDPASLCDDWKSGSRALQVNIGSPSRQDNAWRSSSSLHCDNRFPIYCVGERPIATSTATFTSSPTHTTSPTDTPTPTPSLAVTATSSATPIPQPALTDTPNNAPDSPTSSPHTPTFTPSFTVTPRPATPNPARPTSTPERRATPSESPGRKNPLPEGVIAGDSSAIAGALVYAPDALQVTVADTNGFFRLDRPIKGVKRVSLLFRAFTLPNGGFDLEGSPGEYLSISPATRAKTTLPPGCSTRDHISPLFHGASRITKAYAHFDKLLKQVTREKVFTSKALLGEIERRALHHGQIYYRASAAIPDTQLVCSKSESRCERVDLSQYRRSMLQAVKQLRVERLFLNRLLREKGLRTMSESKATVLRVRQESVRLKTLIASLPRATYRCEMNLVRTQPSAPVAPLRPLARSR